MGRSSRIPSHHPQNDLSSALESFSFSSQKQQSAPQKQHQPSRQPKTPESQRAQLRIAEFVAQNTSSMICYLWFGTVGQSPATQPTGSPGPSDAPSESVPRQLTSPLIQTDLEMARLQFVPSAAFVDFLHKLLTTTQVSQSVIVLSLHYIYRLKSANPHIRGKEGSELRLAVTALMLANKFLDEYVLCFF